jgi:uncharacterized protein (DUF924 family)
MTLPTPQAVHTFWFGDIADEVECAQRNYARWFERGRELDEPVRERFAGLLAAAARGEADHWQATPRSALALVLVLDQFPRHIHRGGARAFATDARARAVCEAGIAAGLDARLLHLERSFFYLPLEHAEDAHAQQRCVALAEHLAASCQPGLRPIMEEGVRYARMHRDTIARFGRFPHRNAALGRDTTPEEARYLAQGAQRYGQ